MWTVLGSEEAAGSIRKLRIAGPMGLLGYRDTLELLRDNGDFRDLLGATLAGTSFRALRWETPPVTAATADRPFECVLLDSPELDVAPDPVPFGDKLAAGARQDGVVVFPNLGGDALLVVPRPLAADTAYPHLLSFLRRAPVHQRHALWHTVALMVLDMLGPSPLWLSTAGAGVAWLHVRLDERPKYYAYAPYRRSSQTRPRGCE